MIGFAALSGSYSTFNAYLTKVLIDGAVNSSSATSNLMSILLVPAILFVLNYEVHNFSWRGIQFIKLKMGPKLQNQIIEEMFAYSEKHSYRFFQDNFSGSISSSINRIAESTFEMVHTILPFLIRQTTQLFFALILMFLVNPYLCAALLIWAIIFMVISLLVSKKIMFLSDNLAEENATLSGKIIDSIANVNNVRLFARESYEVRYLRKYLDNVVIRFRNLEWFSLKLSTIQSLSISLLIIALIFGLIKLRMHDLVTVGDFALILGLALYVTEGIWYLMEQVHRLNDLIGRANQSINMLIIPHEIVDVPDAKKLNVSKGEITFNDVTFHYKGNTNLFEDKSVVIPGGQKVGLVGYSGSGKTTFVNLIVRLFDLTSGTITIDQQDIQKVTQDSLRESIGFIPQDPVLFHRTLMENIRYGKIDATDEEVILAAKKAHADEFIRATPHGYDSLVGERGIKLSGGQRQRISIARAILKNAPILILDEATSALDSVTEGYIQESLTTLMQGKTVIVVAHRLSTLLSMDRILVFDQGEIVQDGTHHSLLQQDGKYAELWNSQVGGFILDKNSEL